MPTFLMFLFLVAFFGVGLFLIYRKQVEYANQFGPTRSIWQHLVADLIGGLKHPHEWAIENDLLMDLALKEILDDEPMPDVAYERLLVKLAEYVNMPEQEGMRPGEREDAALLLLVLPRARRDAKIHVQLTGVRLVGSRAPEDQSRGDEITRENAN